MSGAAGIPPPQRTGPDGDLGPLLGQPVAFHRRLVDLAGGVKPALLLGPLIDWTLDSRRHHHRDTFVRTATQWARDTGLSAKEQAHARQILRALGFLVEQRAGMPARLHSQLDRDSFAHALSEACGEPFEWSADAVSRALGPALPYWPRLAPVAGGVHAALLLSHALESHRVGAGGEGWMHRAVAQWTRVLGLTRREQEAARRSLAAAGLWEERGGRGRAESLARARLDALHARLREFTTAPGYSIGEFIAHSSGEHDLPEPPLQLRPNRLCSFSENAVVVDTSFSKLTSEALPPPSHQTAEPAAIRGGELMLPDRLVAEERTAALTLVCACPQHAQALLDELAGRLEANAVRTSPIGYLRGLVRRAEAGQFVPEVGLRVAAARRQRQEEALRREWQVREDERLAAERATPEYRAKVAARHAQIRQLLGRIRPIDAPDESA